MKESRKEFIKEAHKEACSDWKQKIEKEFPKLFKKTRLESGYWYIGKRHGVTDILCFCSETDGYGFYDGGYIFNADFSLEYLSNVEAFGYDLRLATTEEVGEALIKEAIRKGYDCDNASKVECVFNWSKRTPQMYYKDKKGGFEFDPSRNRLWFLGICIFDNGKWAEIIEETITKKEAEKQLGKKIIN